MSGIMWNNEVMGPNYQKVCESAACVEVAVGDDVYVRSSRDPERSVVFTKEEWAAFTASFLPPGVKLIRQVGHPREDGRIHRCHAEPCLGPVTHQRWVTESDWEAIDGGA